LITWVSIKVSSYSIALALVFPVKLLWDWLSRPESVLRFDWLSWPAPEYRLPGTLVLFFAILKEEAAFQSS
jgi:hypothetical protein